MKNILVVLLFVVLAACKVPDIEPGTPLPPTLTETPVPVPSPTQEFCETSLEEYRVIVPTLYVRSGKGTQFTRIGQLKQGDTFTGSVCLDAGQIYYWVKIIDPSHRYNGNFVAAFSIDGSGKFLDW